MLNIQILVLSLIPLLSGIVPDDRSALSSTALLGMEDSVSEQFLVGTWKYSEDLFRWGLADKEKARIKPSRTQAFMRLREDGTIHMVNFFRPTNGHWHLTPEGIAISGPGFPDRFQILPVRKRDKDRIWLLLPFASGSIGIGMLRIPDEDLSILEKKIRSDTRRERQRSSGESMRLETEPDVPESASLIPKTDGQSDF